MGGPEVGSSPPTRIEGSEPPVAVMPPSRERGAYGFRLRGIRAEASQLVSAPAHWPKIDLRVRVTATPFPRAERLDFATAHLRTRSGASIFVDRTTQQATIALTEAPSTSALVHPHLATVAAVTSYWCGRDCFHAGAFVVDDGVWGLLGEKGSGKSSTLAAMAGSGIQVVCDDLLVLAGSTAFAGPRSIDLRRDAAQRLLAGEPLGLVGERERWRVPLEPILAELPFRGWVTLRWGRGITVRPVRGSARLCELFAHRALQVAPRDPLAMIELSSLPLLEFTRPRRWQSLDDALARLLDAASACL